MPDRSLPGGYISGTEVDPFRSRPSGDCWWCGALANSQEHKFKRSDIKRLQQSGEVLFRGSGDERLSKVNGPNAKVSKFKDPSLCRNCNNARSQPFDRAYDTFVDYTWARAGELQTALSIDMSEVYGHEWTQGAQDLARYYMKHFGCRVVESGFDVPSEIVSFLDRTADMAHVGMAIYKDALEYERYIRGEDGIEDIRGLYVGGLIASLHPSSGQASRFTSETMTGTIGVMFS